MRFSIEKQRTPRKHNRRQQLCSEKNKQHWATQILCKYWQIFNSSQQMLGFVQSFIHHCPCLCQKNQPRGLRSWGGVVVLRQLGITRSKNKAKGMEGAPTWVTAVTSLLRTSAAQSEVLMTSWRDAVSCCQSEKLDRWRIRPSRPRRWRSSRILSKIIHCQSESA